MLFLLLMLAQVQRGLPNSEEFIEAAKAELVFQLDEDKLLKGYAYRRTTSHEKLGRDGTAKETELIEHEIFHSDRGRYEKLISRNGVPLRDEELRKQDEELARKGSRKRDSGPPFAPKSRDDQRAMIDDMFRVWDFQMVRREIIAGRPAIVIAFAPKPGVAAKTSSGKWMFKNARGVAWVDEADHRVVRIRAVVNNDISVAWGVVAKLHKGTEIIREWRKVNDEVWLPSWSQKRIHGSAFMVGFNFIEIEQYSDYRKVDVETNLRFGSPN